MIKEEYKTILAIFGLLVALIFGIMFVLAAPQISNIKDVDYNDLSFGYPRITIKHNSSWHIPFDPIFDVKIKSHTSRCANGKCNSEQIFNSYYNISLVEDVKFVDINGKEVYDILYTLYTYETMTYTEKEIDFENSEKNCIIDLKLSIFPICSYNYVYKDVKKERGVKVPYNLGDKFFGEKIVGIDTDINNHNYIDYVFKSNSIWMDELAGWNISDCNVGGNDLYLDGDYCVHIFTTNGTLNITDTSTAEVLVVGGGGGGGKDYSGGGGAGGLVYHSNYSLSLGTIIVSVGIGGVGSNATNVYGGMGADSVFNGTITALGGGGAASQTTGQFKGLDGGSGGGGEGGGASGFALGLQSNSGGGLGYGYNSSEVAGCGTGGGGAGGNGSAGGACDVVGSGWGGLGRNYTINGTNIFYAGGGGSVNYADTKIHIGGSGVGGNGSLTGNISATDGIRGSGGGGGHFGKGGDGGNGIIIVRYLLEDTDAPYFTTIPANKTINYTQGFAVEFDADDETGFGTFVINSTTLFSINSSGYLQNSTSNIPAGIHNIKVTINDTSNNENSTNWKVTVNKASSSGTLYLNHLEQNISAYEGVNISINGTLDTGVGDITLYVKNQIINTGSSPLFNSTIFEDVGTNEVNLSYLGNENYTSFNNVLYVTTLASLVTTTGSGSGAIPSDKELERIEVKAPNRVLYNEYFLIELKLFDTEGKLFDPLPDNIYLRYPENENFTIEEKAYIKRDIGIYDKEVRVIPKVADPPDYELEFEIIARGINNVKKETKKIIVSTSRIPSLREFGKRFMDNPVLYIFFTFIAVIIISSLLRKNTLYLRIPSKRRGK